MPSSIGQFGSRINIWAKKTQKDMTRYIQRTCRGVAEEIIKNSPVDTGLYLGSWTPSIYTPKTSNDFVPGASRYTKDRKRRSEKMIAQINSMNRARAMAHVLAKLNAVIPLVNAHTPFYFNNGVRYARYVEYGGGATPPYAVVRKAMQKFRRALQTSATFGSGTGSNVARSTSAFEKEF